MPRTEAGASREVGGHDRGTQAGSKLWDHVRGAVRGQEAVRGNLWGALGQRVQPAPDRQVEGGGRHLFLHEPAEAAALGFVVPVVAVAVVPVVAVDGCAVGIQQVGHDEVPGLERLVDKRAPVEQVADRRRHAHREQVRAHREQVRHNIVSSLCCREVEHLLELLQRRRQQRLGAADRVPVGQRLAIGARGLGGVGRLSSACTPPSRLKRGVI